MRTPAVAAVLCLLAGCGVYAVHVDPPPHGVPLPARPVDASISLGAVETIVDGRPVPTGDATIRALDAEFVRAATRSGLFRNVVPAGSPADLRCDVRRELHSAPATPGRALYLALAGPLPFVAPGFPHPWDYRVTRVVRLRGDVDGNDIPLLARRTAYDERIWSAMYWGGLDADPLRAREADYVVAALGDTVTTSRPVLDDFAAAARAHDVEGAWLVGLRASRDQAPPL